MIAFKHLVTNFDPLLLFCSSRKNKDDKYYYDLFSVNHKYLGKILWQPI